MRNEEQRGGPPEPGSSKAALADAPRRGLPATTDHLMAALRAGDFASGRLLAGEIGKQTILEVNSAPDADARAAVFRESLAAIGDALHLARVLRAHLSAQLNANTGTMSYQQSETEQSRWRIQA